MPSAQQQHTRSLLEGNYGAYVEDLKWRKGADAYMRTGIKYKQTASSVSTVATCLRSFGRERS